MTTYAGRYGLWSIFIGGVIFLSACGGFPGKDAIAKPTVPISFKLVLDPPSLDGSRLLTVRVKPKIDAPLLKIRIEIPEGIQITQGEKRWSGSLAKGEEKIFQIGINILDPSEQRIYGFATIEYPDGTRLTKSALVTISSPEGASRKKNEVQPQLKKNRFNEDILEFPGEVPNQ